MADTNGIMWIGNNNGELARFNPNDSVFIRWSRADSIYLVNHFKHRTLPNVDNFYKDRTGGIWIGTYNGCYHYVSPLNEHDTGFTGYLEDKRVTCLYESIDGVMWIGTARGLHRWDRKTNHFTVYRHNDNAPTSISGDFITGIAEDKQGNMWIATGSGLNMHDPKDTMNTFVRFIHDADEPTSIGSSLIFSQYMDSSNVLWLATLGGGISKLDLNQKHIQVYRNKKSDSNSLSDNRVTAIVEDKDSIVWIGTAYGGLNAWNRKTNQIVRYMHDSTNTKTLPGNQVGALLVDSDGDLWVGTGKATTMVALSRYNRATLTFENYLFKYNYASPPSGNALLSLYQARNGIIWAGTAHGYLRFNKKTKRFLHMPYDPNNADGISDYWVNCFYEDKNGYMWMGPNSNALNKLDTSTGRVMHYRHTDGDPTSIASTIVKSMFKDSKGQAWFGTRSGGLSLLNEDDESFSNYTTRDGLPSNTVFAITEDAEHHLWLATNKGLCMFNQATKKVVTYTTADGLPGNHFESEVGSSIPAYTANDGTLLFGGPNGLIVFDPKTMLPGRAPGEVVITQFKIFDRPLQGLVSDTISLDYDENFVSFEFASLNYVNPSENKYAYKLNGLDKDWVYSESQRLASYTNLAPGHYTFLVKASNDDDHWQEIKKPVVLVIQPPWWKTWWFYSAVVLLLVGAVYALFRYRLNQKINIYRIRNRIHRDLHDDVGATLSSVKAYSEILKDNPDKPMIADLIIENANDMIVSLEDISWATNPHFDNLGSLISKIRKFAVPLLRPKRIEFDITAAGLDDTFELPGEVRRNMLLTVKEAVNNVYKYSMAKKCSIKFSLANRSFLVAITDDGVGMNGVMQGTGNGMKNMQNRIKELHGKMHVESPNGSGTMIHVAIHFPFHFTPLKDAQN
jgi:ligand-binding sensor domain-containing protein